MSEMATTRLGAMRWLEADLLAHVAMIANVTAPSNVWTVECRRSDDLGTGVRWARLLSRPPDTNLVSAVWELEPGASSQYHLHHATEELLLMLDGEASLRTPEGERGLARGDVVHFPAGAGGAHQVTNRSNAIIRYMMVAAHGPIDAVEFVDESRVVVCSDRESLLQLGPLWVSDGLSQEEEAQSQPDGNRAGDTGA